jgi:arylsulfatase A-like enzyme
VGIVSSQLVCLTDLFATIADVIGEEIPDTAAEDSFSFAAVLRDEAAVKPVRDHLVSHSINGSFAIRRGNWKLMLCSDSGGWSDPRPKSKQAANLPSRQLYDLAADLGEQDNRIEDQPAVADELLELLRKVVRDGRSTPGVPQANFGEINIGE